MKILLKDNDNLLKQIEQERNEKNKNKKMYSISKMDNTSNNFNSNYFIILRQIGQGSYGKIF